MVATLVVSFARGHEKEPAFINKAGSLILCGLAEAEGVTYA
jgi:hypothetical protein